MKSGRAVRLRAVLALLILTVSMCAAQQQTGADLTEADRLFDSEAYAEARTIYRRYLDLTPEGEGAAHAAFRIADAWRLDTSVTKQRRLNEAIASYELALADHPEYPGAPEAYYQLALSYIDLGFVQDAVIQLRRARERYSDAANADKLLLLLADSYYTLDDFEQAALHYRTYIDTYARAAPAMTVRLKLADSYHRVGDYAHARAEFARIIQQRPKLLEDDPNIRFRWAETLLNTGDLEGAEQQFRLLLVTGTAESLEPHVQLRLGDVSRLRAAKMGPDEDKAGALREAMELYYSVWHGQKPARVAESALLRLVQTADIADADLEKLFGMKPPGELLDEIFERNIDPEVRALILINNARHQRARGRLHRAMEYYKQAVQDYRGIELADQVASEYHRLVRDILQAAWKEQNYSRFMDVYLGYGLELNLEHNEKLQLAIAAAKVGLNQRAKDLFEELRKTGLEDEEQLLVALYMMDIDFARKDYVGADREAQSILEMKPTPQQRERALLMTQKILFALRDLDQLQKRYLEDREQFNTPALRASALQKLGTLHFIKGNFDEARDYIEEFMDEFGQGEPGNAERYDMIRQATLTLADIYFHDERFADAAALYERYIILYSPSGVDISWPLLQDAHCRRNQGHSRLAEEMYRTFMALYPDHYLKSQAEQGLAELQAARGGQ